MKKRVFGRQLSRERDTRRALFRSLVRALVLNGKIKTTKAKAKAVQGLVDQIITLGKDESIAARRKLYSVVGNDRVVEDFIVGKVAPKFTDRKSGFTRIVNLPRRVGDNAKVVRLEWVEEVEKYVKPVKIKSRASDKDGKSIKGSKGIKSTKSSPGRKDRNRDKADSKR